MIFFGDENLSKEEARYILFLRHLLNKDIKKDDTFALFPIYYFGNAI